MSTIAFFDFDGTITSKDSFVEFMKRERGAAYFYAGMLLHLPVLVGMKTGLLSNQRVKEMVLSFCFRKWTKDKLEQAGHRFAAEVIPSLIRPKAAVEIAKLKGLGAEVVIVTASPQEWIKPWCDTQGLGCVASALEYNSDRFTGKLAGKNCYGEEKVKRIQQQFDLSQYSKILAYGDTKGDQPMLQLATHAFFKPFR